MHITFDDTGNREAKGQEDSTENSLAQSLATQKYERLLASRMKREEVLKTAMEELQTQKNMWGKGKKFKTKEDNLGNTVWKWRSERKK
jgi:hypothetical protein